MTSKAHVVVYSRPGCHLCEEALATIEGVPNGGEFTIEEVNIESDPELLARYQHDIPVIVINGVETFMHRVDPAAFKAKVSLLRNLAADFTDNTDQNQKDKIKVSQ